MANQLPRIIIQETSNTSQNPKNLTRKYQLSWKDNNKKKILIWKEIPKIADMDFMKASKTRIVISESAMGKGQWGKGLLHLKWYIKPSVTEVEISGSDTN